MLMWWHTFWVESPDLLLILFFPEKTLALSDFGCWTMTTFFGYISKIYDCIQSGLFLLSSPPFFFPVLQKESLLSKSSLD